MKREHPIDFALRTYMLLSPNERHEFWARVRRLRIDWRDAPRESIEAQRRSYPGGMVEAAPDSLETRDHGSEEA